MEENKVLVFHETTEEEKYAICEWKYDDEYAIYNSTPYEEQVAAKREFANPRNHFFSFCDAEALIGYINLIEEEKEVIFGIGVNPEYCNQGYGQKITRLARNLSNQLYPGKPVCLEVRTWNIRAVKCYEKAGFHIVGQPTVRMTPIGEGSFYCMVAE